MRSRILLVGGEWWWCYPVWMEFGPVHWVPYRRAEPGEREDGR